MGAASDRHEALHLILGFCKDYGLNESFKALVVESGVDVNGEELAPHVSLMRLLLDWKRAFEARFHGTPRIIQAVAKPAITQVVAQPQHLLNQPAQVVLNQPVVEGAQQLATAGHFQPLQAATAATQDGQLQTIHYVTNTSGPVNGQQLFRQPVIVSQAQQLPAQFVALQQPQQLGQAQQQAQQLAGGDVLDANNNLLLRQPVSGGAATQPTLLLGLNPRGPAGTGMALPAHSSSLYSAGEQQDCSRDVSTHDWNMGQQNHVQAKGEETGHSRGGQWVAVGNASPGALLSGRRVSSSGSGPTATKLRGGMDPINQETFMAAIRQAGPGAAAAQLFDFRRPQRGAGSTARRSAILQLEEGQHDAMYALAGCEDVNFLISNVQSEVRVAMTQVFGIDKESFTVWFKNRGRNPSKMQYGAPGASRPSTKRVRMSEPGGLGND